MGYALAIDTFAYAKKLKAAGFSEEQAEVQVEALAEIVEEQLATKRDLKDLEMALRHEIKELEMRLTIRLGIMLGAGIAIVATLIKLL